MVDRPDAREEAGPRERRRRQERVEILDAAAELFGRQGYSGTSIQEIAARCEFSVGKIYKLFPSKEDLFKGILDHHVEEMDRQIEEIRREGLGALEELHRRMRRLLAYLGRHEGFLRVYFLENPLRFGGYLREKKREDRREAAALLERAVAEGDLPADVDTELVATALRGCLESLVERRVEAGRGDRLEEVADQVAALLLDPLVRRGGERGGR